MIRILCDICGAEIKALSNKPKTEKKTGVQVDQYHVCCKCIKSLIKQTNEREKQQSDNVIDSGQQG